MIWRVTEHCGFGCSFCAYDRAVRRVRREADGGLVIALGRRIARARPGAHVSFLGGEPFVWRPLFEVGAALFAEGLSLGLTTNGWSLAEPRQARFCNEHLDEVTVSLDGNERFHDAIRARPGSYARALAGLRALAGPRARVNTVLMADNVDQLDDVCAAAEKAGAHELTFNQLGGRDRPDFFARHRLRPSDVDRLVAMLPALRARYSLDIRGSDAYLERLAASARGEALPVDDCAPGRTSWFVDVDGRIAPCSFTVDGYGVGPESLDALPERFAERRRCRLAVCDDCPSTHVFEKFA